MKPKRDMHDLLERANHPNEYRSGDSSRKHSATTLPEIAERLGKTASPKDLGLIRGWQARHLEQTLELETYSDALTAKHREIARLAEESLKAQGQLIRETLRIDFNHRYAALAERAAVAEMTVITKLQDVLETARIMLWEDRKGSFTQIDRLYEEGYLSDEEFAQELAHCKTRYQKLMDEFASIIDQLSANVRGAFRKKGG
jgi:hypothetical protein